MGYSGLDSWICSDNAAGLVADVMDSLAAKLKRQLKRKDNEFNTDGAVDVALFFESFLLPAKRVDCLSNDRLNEIALDAKERLTKLLDETKELPAWRDKAMHLTAYKRMIRSLDKFLAVGD